MATKTKALIGILLAGAALVTALAVHELRALRHSSGAGVVGTGWPAGTRRRYAIDWQTRNAASLPGTQPLEGTVDLAGELSLESLGITDGALHLRFGFTRLDRASVQILGRDATGGKPGELVGPEAHALYE